MALAVKKENSWSMPFFGNNNSKFEEAAELYVKAGNSFKANKIMDKASDAYTKAAESYLKSGSKHDAASNYVISPL